MAHSLSSSPDDPSADTHPRHARGSVVALVKGYGRTQKHLYHEHPLSSGFSDHHLGLADDDVERDGETTATSYGTGAAPRRRRASTNGGPFEGTSAAAEAGEGTPLIGRRKSEPHDNVAANINVHVGESSDGQTLFNSIGVLIGIGLLSMPLAFSYAGWIGGTLLVIAFSALTCHTGKLLGRLIFADVVFASYTDIGMAAFGTWGGVAIQFLFCTELFAFGVALIVLFGDSMHEVVPHFAAETWMALGFFLVLPTTFMPLRWLAVPSVLSTIAIVVLIGIILFDGLWKKHAPGSILHPMPTRLGPDMQGMNWLGGVGLALASYGGHAVIPSLAKDMRNPRSMDRVFNISFAVACAVAFVSGAAGYLMMGDAVSDEISKDLMNPKYGYPPILNKIALWMIVLVPLTKYGLTSRPLNVAIEAFLGLAPIPHADDEALSEGPASVDAGASSMSRVRRVSFALSNALGHIGESDYSIGSSISADGTHHDYRRKSLAQPHSPRSPASSQAQARAHAPPAPAPTTSVSPAAEGGKGVLRAVVRALITGGCTIVAIALPGFEKVMAFLGSFSAFLICIILPIGFYLRLAPRVLGVKDGAGARLQRVFHVVVLVISTVLMCLGTAWTCMPGTGGGPV